MRPGTPPARSTLHKIARTRSATVAGSLQRPLRRIAAAAFCMPRTATRRHAVAVSAPRALLLDALHMGPGFPL